MLNGLPIPHIFSFESKHWLLHLGLKHSVHAHPKLSKTQHLDSRFLGTSVTLVAFPQVTAAPARVSGKRVKGDANLVC